MRVRTVTAIVLTGSLVVPLVLMASAAPAAAAESNGRVAYDNSADGDSEIYSSESDGSDEQQLTNNSDEDTAPDYAPNSEQIAFQSDRDGNDEVYVMDADGSNQTNLTNNAADDRTPTWNPGTGQQIAFSSDRDGNRDIYSMNADGSDQTNLTNTAGGIINVLPVWSPDGTKIMFSRFVTDYDVYVMDADGSNVVNVTNSPGSDDFGFAWSPGMSTILFASDRDNQNFELYTVMADGSGPVLRLNDTVTLGGPPTAVQATYSPSGEYILTSDWSGGLNVLDANGTYMWNIIPESGVNGVTWGGFTIPAVDAPDQDQSSAQASVTANGRQVARADELPRAGADGVMYLALLAGLAAAGAAFRRSPQR